MSVVLPLLSLFRIHKPQMGLRTLGTLRDMTLPTGVDGSTSSAGERSSPTTWAWEKKTRQAIIALTEAAPSGPYLVVCPA